MPVVLVIEDFKHLTECARTQDFYDLETVGDVIADKWFIILLLVAKALFVLDEVGCTFLRCAL